MPGDRSRRIDTPAHGYILPIAQQGRVVLDRDFNAWGSFLNARIDADALDFVGPCGTPDNGFAISLPTTSPPGGFWSPPLPESPPAGEGAGRDFLISGGTMYVGGLRVEWPVKQGGQAITYTYADQPELPPPSFGLQTELLFRPPQELVLLDVTLQEVSAAEDPDLLDVALGGPDTTQRLKQRVRVERMTVEETSCIDAWAQAVATWQSQGLLFDPATMRLWPAVQLQVGFTQAASTGGPCDPVAAGGFLGQDNQLIRVQVAGGTLLWGYDNASFLYRIQVAADRQTITLIGGPPDTQHYPQTGQVVEILTTASVIDSVPDQLDDGSITRAAAQPTGQLFTLTQPYGPAAGSANNVLVLPTPLDPAVLETGLPLFLRVWEAQLQPPALFNTPITLQDSKSNSTGVTVTLSNATVAADGAFWQIAVRPSTPQGVYPEELALAPQWADGPVRVVCPLAVIDWTAATGPAIADCRSSFDNLVTLSKRKPGCCTIAIAPADLTPQRTLQNVIDAAFLSAASVTVCLAPGSYALAAPLTLTWLHRGLTLECCGGAAIFTAAAGADTAAFGNGMITLNGAANVTLTGLTLCPPLVAIPQDVLNELIGNLSSAAQSEAGTLLRAPSLSIGIHACNSTGVNVQSCGFELFRGVTRQNIDVLAAGLLLRGNCANLTVQKCSFGASLAPTYNSLDTTVNYTNYVAANRQAVSDTPAATAGTITSGASLAAAPSLTLSQAPVLNASLANTFAPDATLATNPTIAQAAPVLTAAAPGIANTISPASHVTIQQGMTIVMPAETPVTVAGSVAQAPTLQAVHQTLDTGGTVAPAATAVKIEAAPVAETRIAAVTLAQPRQEPQANAGATTPGAAPIAVDAVNATAENFALANAGTVASTSMASAGSVSSQASVTASGLIDTVQQIYASTGLAQILASRSNANLLRFQRPMVASCGIAAATFAPPAARGDLTEAAFAATLEDCTLDAALIRDNKFSNLTFATLLVAGARALRLQDNDATGMVAGFWLALPKTSPAADPVEGTDIYSETFSNFEECQALVNFLPSLPLPPGAIARLQARAATEATDTNASTTDSAVAARLNAETAVSFSVFVTGNHISTGQHPPPAANPVTGTSAIMLWLIPDIGLEALSNSDISAVIANNHCITAAAGSPAVMLALAGMQSAAVTGNLIFNQPGPIQSDGDAPSLWVVLSQLGEVPATGDAINAYEIPPLPFSATGNVLRGRSDLALLRRGAAAQRAGWSGYNADPN